ncbi:hypothetical protein [Streptomyces sp. NPDC058086]|uniref:hypothetical protein n=1 Tax=Streptomyces sp. NPDC058086 TaxID=3346334 RepID=UPI0036F0FD21
MSGHVSGLIARTIRLDVEVVAAAADFASFEGRTVEHGWTPSEVIDEAQALADVAEFIDELAANGVPTAQGS